MPPSTKFPFQVFDPSQDFSIVERRLPHWSQVGTISFITWRTYDSLPKEVLNRWISDRERWLKSHGISPACDWKSGIQSLGRSLRDEFNHFISERWHEALDACHGECVLRCPELAEVVANSLLHFDGNRYELTDFVIMPNHVHVLVAFLDESSMLQQCDSWKHYTATNINRQLGRQGHFWQSDGFDHLVRSIEQFEHLRRYIANNPHRANLQPNEYLHMSKPL